MRVILLILLLSNVYCEITINHNVAFNTRKQISSSKAHWLLTVVFPTAHYHPMLNNMRHEVKRTQALIHKLVTNDKFRNDSVIKGYASELHILQTNLQETTDAYLEYKTLLTGSRSKRSILPFIGNALNVLFGTVTTSDLETLKRNIGKLEENEKQMIHIVQENFSVLKSSKIEVMENRKALNQIIVELSKFHKNINSIASALSDDITLLRITTTQRFRLDLLNAHIKTILDKVTMSLHEMRHKIDVLANQKLTPSIISPYQLTKVLNQISIRLPTSLKLPMQPEPNLWTYYHALTCITVINDQNLLVMIPIPLQVNAETYKLIEAHNLPLPMPEHDKPKRIMTAKYEIESSFIAIDLENEKYSLLTTQEFKTCLQAVLGFCDIKSPAYPLNFDKYCIIALYKGNANSVKSLCKTKVLMNTQLPTAEYLVKGSWAVSTLKPLIFNVKCFDKRSYKITVQFPIEIINLPLGCAAYSDFLSLNPYYSEKSAIHMNLTTPVHVTYTNFPDLSLWNPLTSKIPSLEEINWPESLNDVKHIEMQPLVQRLLLSQDTQTTPNSQFWNALTLTAFIQCMILSLGIMCIIFKLYLNRQTNASNDVSQGKAEESIELPTSNIILPPSSSTNSSSNTDME